MEILYCDNHVLVAVKPHGISTQLHEGETEGFDVLAKEFVKREFNKEGNVFLEPIHRIDKPVGGIVIFARTSKALSRLQEEMRQQKIERYYLAEVEGIPLKVEDELVHYLYHDHLMAKIVPKTFREAKEAKLTYRLMKSSVEEKRALLEVRLQTGRYHQIRAQLSAIGHPIWGDTKYGSKQRATDAISLFHYKTSFIHPVKKEGMEFTYMPSSEFFHLV